MLFSENFLRSVMFRLDTLVERLENEFGKTWVSTTSVYYRERRNWINLNQLSIWVGCSFRIDLQVQLETVDDESPSKFDIYLNGSVQGCKSEIKLNSFLVLNLFVWFFFVRREFRFRPENSGILDFDLLPWFGFP